MAALADGNAEEVLAKLLERLPGVQAISVSTDDGGCVLRVVGSAAPAAESGDGEAPAAAAPLAVDGGDAEATLVSLFTFASEQIGKMQFGEVQSMTAFYSGSCLVHVNCAPLVLTFVGGTDMNVGLVLAASKLLVPQLQLPNEATTT